MKLISLFLLCLPLQGITVVAHTAAVGATTGTATTPNIDTTGANKIIVAVSEYDDRGAVLTDSNGNSWTLLSVSSAFPSDSTIAFYCSNPTSVGPGHNFTYAASASYPSLAVIALSGMDVSSCTADQSVGNTTNTTNSITSGTVTPSTNSQIVIAATSVSGTETITATNFTLADSVTHIVGYNIALSYQIQGAATAVSETFQWASTANSVVIIASFKGSPNYLFPLPMSIIH